MWAPLERVAGWFGYTTPAGRPAVDGPAPAPSRGILDWFTRRGTPWAGPTRNGDTAAEEDLSREKVKRGPPGVVLPNFLPYLDENTSGTGETAAMRMAYRRMLGDASIKAALLGKLLAVAAKELKFHPLDKKDKKDQEKADFCRWAFIDQLGGTPTLVENCILPGLVDGYSLAEKVFDRPDDSGPWAGKIPLLDLATIDSGNDAVLETDDRKRVVSVMGLRYNAGEHFHPSAFVIWSHLPLYGQPTGMSDFRAAYRPFWVLDTAWKLRLIALDRRATGLLKGRYKTASVKESLEAALKAAKSFGYLSLPETAEVEVLDLASKSGDDMFQSAIKDALHQVFLCIEGATLQSVEGETTDGRGDSQVHQSTAELRRWWLSRAVELILNGRRAQPGLIKDLVDLNYVGGRYPRATLGAIDVNEVKARLDVRKAVKEIGLPQSKAEIYEESGVSPPDEADPGDVLDGDKPQQPGPPGPGGGPPQPPQHPDRLAELTRRFDAFAERVESFAGGYDEAKHPRGPDGHWVKKEEIAAAAKDPKKAAAIRSTLSDDNKAKFDAALKEQGGPKPTLRDRAAGLIPAPVRRALAQAKSVAAAAKAKLDAFNARVDRATNVPVLKQLKAVKRFVAGKVGVLKKAMEARYGKVGAAAVFLSGQALGWTWAPLALATHLPVVLPGASLIMTVPGAAIAESVLQAYRVWRGARKLLGLGKHAEADKPFPTLAEIKRVWKEFNADLTAGLAAHLGKAAPDKFSEPRPDAVRAGRRFVADLLTGWSPPPPPDHSYAEEVRAALRAVEARLDDLAKRPAGDHAPKQGATDDELYAHFRRQLEGATP